MRARARGLTAWVAILAIALQALLAGFAAWSPAAAATIDPATVICHSVPPGADSGEQAPSPTAHDDCCSQCILCSIALGLGNLAAGSVVKIPPRLVIARLIPLSAIVPSEHRDFGPNLPRGPPSFA